MDERIPENLYGGNMREAFPSEPSAEEKKRKALEAERGLFGEYLENLGLEADDLRDKVVLDVGAGSRMFAAHVLREGLTEKVYSVEPDVRGAFPEEQEMLALTLSPEEKDRLDGMTMAGRWEALSLKDGSVDLLVSNGASPGSEWRRDQDLEAVRKGIDDAFEEAVRVLKAGGEARLFPFSRGLDGRQEPWREAIDAKLDRVIIRKKTP
jgi:hypothetical protein